MPKNKRSKGIYSLSFLFDSSTRKYQLTHWRSDLALLRWNIERIYVTLRFRLAGFPVYAVKIREGNYLIHLDRPIKEVWTDPNEYPKRLHRAGFQLKSVVGWSSFWFEVKR